MKALYDKIALRGAGALTDEELVAFLVDDEGVAARLLSECGSLAGVMRMPLSRLRMFEGLGLRKAKRLAVATELGRRLMAADADTVGSISTSGDVARIFRPLIEGLKHEECWVLYLTNSNRIIERQRVSQGGVQGTVVDHRLIAKRALELLATQVLMVHNHPSGAAEPSEQDKALTRKIAGALALFDIRLLDHIILSSDGEFSFRQAGLL